jgi:hypothetical protein
MSGARRRVPNLDGSYDRPLMAWLRGEKFYLKSPNFIMNKGYKPRAAWVTIDLAVPLHETSLVTLQSFDAAWEQTLRYIGDACRMLHKDIPGWAPAIEEADGVLGQLGLPPLRCYALYLISVQTAAGERCVYVGQTNSESHRFQGGHAAISKLHHPKYERLAKRVYFAGLEIEDDDDHAFPIEWIHPEEWRQQILDSVESRLIFELQPELNEKGRLKLRCSIDLPITVHNSRSDFLASTTTGRLIPIENGR